MMLSFTRLFLAAGSLVNVGAKLLAKLFTKGGSESTRKVPSSKTSTKVQRITGAPTTIAGVRRLLGRTGLLDSKKVALVRALPEEIPRVPNVTFFGWVSEQGGRLATDRRGRVVIKLTDQALASVGTAVETVGHELHHVGEIRAGSGASERAAEDAAKAYRQRFLQRLRQLE